MDKEKYFENIATYRLLAKKEVGQNFLIDVDAAERIVASADIQDGEKVLEIGAGAGSLTYFLADEPGELEAIDIDEALIAKLNNDLPSVNVHYGNAARFDYSPYDIIIGNLPYYITSSIIERCLLLGINAKRMIFMIQKEAGERLLAPVGSGDYGPLNVLLAWRGKCKREFGVSRNCFAPAPHVDSVVISISDMTNPDVNLKKAYGFCANLFRFRRKTISNNLKGLIGNKELLDEILKEADIAPNARPETITPERFMLLFNIVESSRK